MQAAAGSQPARFIHRLGPNPFVLVCAVILVGWPSASLAQAPEQPAPGAARPARNDAELRRWLASMAIDHGYSIGEMAPVLGLDQAATGQALARFGIDATARPEPHRPGSPLKVLPYPGGRHPRLGFFDGAIDPQRETKLSVFPPWSDGGYAVADVPEAIWFVPEGGRQLLYLAHTHVPTVWSRMGVELPRLEWRQNADGTLDSERTLPNGVAFATHAEPRPEGVRLRFTVVNGSQELLTGLDVQMCVMLGRLQGFAAQTNDNKRFVPPLAACHDTSGRRWIITGFERAARVWGNPPCPCLHSDPRVEDCPAGESRSVRGWISFYEGTAIDEHLAAIAQQAFAER